MTASAHTFVRSDWLIVGGSALLIAAVDVTLFAHVRDRGLAIIPADALHAPPNSALVSDFP